MVCKFLCFSLVLVILTGCDGRRAVPMEKFRFDLQLPAEERWNNILAHYESSFPAIMRYIEKYIPSEILPLVELVMKDLDHYFGELGQEMRGIANFTKINLGAIVGINLSYELRRLGGGHPHIINSTGTAKGLPQFTMGCTSIVAQDDGGSIHHGRNLDWDLPDDVRNTTIEIDYYHGDELLFKGVTSVGFVGILTGVSPHGYSVSINERDLGGNIVVNAIDAILYKAQCPSHLLRQVLTSSTSYKEAVQILSETPIVSPVYYIVGGGNGEGAILTRDRNSLPKPLYLTAWYLLQTNYDHWEEPPSYDDRRYYGNLYMQSEGKEVGGTSRGVVDVLSTWPVCNSYTTYTAIMTPSSFDMTSYNIYDC